MLKAILLCGIFIACTACGRMLTASRQRRVKTMGDLLGAVRVLRLRMLNSTENVCALLGKSDFEAFRKIGGGGTDPEANYLRLRDGFTAHGGALDCLSADDVKALDNLFAHLGKSDRQQQSLLLSDVISHLEEVQLHARQQLRDSARMSTALGALVGIGICVIVV